MVGKISVRMVPYTLGAVKNIDKALLVSLDSKSSDKNQTCEVLKNLFPNRLYDCVGSIGFYENIVANQTFNISTDYGGKCNAYFWFTFHLFLGTPTMKPIIWVSWG